MTDLLPQLSPQQEIANDFEQLWQELEGMRQQSMQNYRRDMDPVLSAFMQMLPRQLMRVRDRIRDLQTNSGYQVDVPPPERPPPFATVQEPPPPDFDDPIWKRPPNELGATQRAELEAQKRTEVPVQPTPPPQPQPPREPTASELMARDLAARQDGEERRAAASAAAPGYYQPPASPEPVQIIPKPIPPEYSEPAVAERPAGEGTYLGIQNPNPTPREINPLAPPDPDPEPQPAAVPAPQPSSPPGPASPEVQPTEPTETVTPPAPASEPSAPVSEPAPSPEPAKPAPAPETPQPAPEPEAD